MKQAIQEGFILDVLEHYTPVDSYYRLTKKVEDDPEFDTKRAQKKLRHYVESHDHAIRQKAEIMVDHFHEQVLARQLIGGEARAMVVTDSIARAIQYFHAFQAYLVERRSPHRAIVAFSDTVIDGEKVTEGQLNGFPGNLIAERIREDPFRFLICAEKFQTGYDEPLLHTMYVDKKLSGIKAVQTLSRLNRAHPKKRDTFVLDFQNDADTIREAFQDYYQTTILSAETDPNKLHDLKADLDGRQIYSDEEVATLVERYLGEADRDTARPDPRRLRRALRRCARRRRPGRLQGQGESVCAHVQLPRVGSAIQQRRLGTPLNLPQLPHPETARAEGGGPLEGHPRDDRHGQLPRRSARGD